MTAPLPFVFILLGLIISARVRLGAVIFGQPVSVPVLGMIAVVVVLALAAALLVLVHLILRDVLPLRARAVGT